MRCRPHALAISVVAVAAGGCAHHPARWAAGAQGSRALEQDSLETAIGKIRKLQTVAKPATERSITLETQPGDLKDALGLASVNPSGPNLRRVAEAYLRANLLDQAYSY